MKKFDYVDSLRGLAILGVMCVHAVLYGNSNPTGTFQNIFLSGATGVQLFFLASAFTLFLSYKSRSANEMYPVKNFFIRRFFRIAPMYYLGICYYLFQDGFGPRYWLGDETQISVFNILSNVTFLHGFNPRWINSLVQGGWSIGVEMMFYFSLPFLFSKVKSINQAFLFFLGSLILNAFLYQLFTRFPFINHRIWNEYLFFYFPSQLPVFMLGVILYFVVIERESLGNISGKWILAFSGLVLLHFAIGYNVILPNHILFGFGFFILAYALSVYKFKLLVNPVINYLGKISFSMYLVHFAVLHWLQRFQLLDYSKNGLVSFTIRFLIVVALSTVIASVFYNIIEVPFQKLGKYIIDRCEKKSSRFALVVNRTTGER